MFDSIPTTEVITAISAVVFIATCVQTITGFGFSIIATPLLVVLIEPRLGIQVNILMSLLMVSTLSWVLWREANIRLLKHMISAAALAAPFGVIIGSWVPDDFLVSSVGGILLMVGALRVVDVVFLATPKKSSTAGAASGFLASALGMPGPPILAYLSGIGCEKSEMRATSLLFFVIVYLLAIFWHSGIGDFQIAAVSISLLSIPALAVGLFFGNLIHKRVPAHRFEHLITALVILIGLSLCSRLL